VKACVGASTVAKAMSLVDHEVVAQSEVDPGFGDGSQVGQHRFRKSHVADASVPGPGAPPGSQARSCRDRCVSGARNGPAPRVAGQPSTSAAGSSVIFR
jgi:hypothetical protein